MQIPGKYNMADIAQRLSEFMKEKQYEAGECLTEVCIKLNCGFSLGDDVLWTVLVPTEGANSNL